MSKQRRDLPWAFMVGDTRVDVHCGTGHYSMTVNLETGEFGKKSVYVFDAAITEPGGKRRESWVTRSYLNGMRRFADDPKTNVRTVKP